MDSAVIFEDRENLNDFLEEAELQQYYELFRDILKVSKVSQLKFVLTEDLVQIGLSRPEQRRYKKIYTKYFPNPYISKIRKMLKSNKKRDQNAQGVSMPSEILPVFDNNVKIPTKHIISIEDITINKELGMGQFGVVQQGTWTTGNQRLQVAIKCLGHEQMTSNSTEFLKEAAVMHSIEHPNIVRLYGVVLHLDSLMLVTELAPLRSLLECLREVSLRLNFPVPNLCEFAEQICDGMTYLESKRLIHRDLAARNILVFNKDRVKISDFGLSRALGVGKDYYQTNYNVNLKLPVAWCAPECILFLRFTSASDVWAFGVCLWEMFTYGFQPWAAFSGQQILEAIDAPNFQRLERPECCPEAYYATMLECWAHDFNNRPKFKDLGPKLRSIRPEQVQALTDCQKPEEGRRNNYLDYKSGQIITVLGKQSMTKSSMWYGVLPGCACGMFDPSQMKPYIPPEKNVCHVSGTISPHPIRHSARSIRSSLLRSDVKRHTYTGKRTIQRSMISSPQGDVKHTGHVGLDGAYFGDISFLDPAGCPPRQVVTPYKPSEDLEQVPLINPNSPSHLTGATGTTPYPMLTSNRPDSKANCDEVDLSCENKTKSLKKVNNKMTSESSSGKSILNKVRCATLSRSHKVDNGAAPKTDEVHEYHEITDNNMDAAALYNKSDTRLAPKPENLDVGKSTTDFSQSLLDEMESMFRNLDCKRRDEPSTSSKHAESATSVPPISRFFNLPDPQDMGVRTYVRPQPRMYRRPAYLPGPRPSRSHRRSGEARESSRSDECSKTRWRVKHEGTQTSHRNRPRSEEPRIRSHRRPASGERPTTHRTRSSTEEPGITRSKRSGSAETSNTKRITHRNRSSSEEAGIRTHVHFADVHETNTKRITHRNRSSSEEAGIRTHVQFADAHESNTKRISHRNRSSSEEAGISHRIEPEYEVPRSHTLTKAERKKGFATSTMKPMSAHDEKTLNTAVALANEITSKSMNDLGGDKKYPQSPSDRSKFHFKFPLSLHHTSHGHEPEKEKESAGRVERRNFSEEARSVPDLQSTITAESKLVYTSLVEEPTPSTSLGNTRGTHMGKESTGILKPPAIPNPATIPKPVRVTTQVQFHSLQNHSSLQARPYARGHTEDFDYYAENVLPLPPRTTKPKLVDKPRHIRKYPLKIMEPKAPLASADGSPIIIYQNTKRPVHEQEPKKVEVDGNKVEDEEVVVIDEVDASSKLDINTNPFTNVAGPSHINPFSTFYDEDTEDDWTLQLYMNSETDSDESLTVLVKDCKDHVSVEDLLEFADLKPCGRQRGVESDEVRIMCKVLKSQATPEQCLEALELSDWDVHNAIKLVRVKVTVGSTVSFEECHHQLKKSNGDIVKAINILAT